MISKLYLKKMNSLRFLKLTGIFLTTFFAIGLNAQTVFWSDNFDAPAGGVNNNNAAAGWALNVNASGGNQWYINGGSTCGGGSRLHISCGGGLCGILGGPGASIYNAGTAATDKYSSSPDISTVGRTSITLKFSWKCNGQANNDYGLLRLSNDGGANWTDLATKYQSASSCQNATITIPAQYENISNFRIAFRWINNGDNAGSDPPFDIDNIELSVPSVSCPVVINNQSFTQPTCHNSNNGTVTITASGGSTLTYTINSGSPIVNSTGLFSGLPAGTYLVSVSDGTCSTTGTNIVLTNPLAITAPTASSNSPLCQGDTMKLLASVVLGATYAWTGPNGNNFNIKDPTKLNVAPADAGSYSVIATIGTCSSNSASTNVAVTTIPATPTASSNSPLCEGATLNLSSTTISGSTYDWTGPNNYTNQQNPSKTNIALADSGIYSVVAVFNNCKSSPATTTVVVNPTPASPIASSNSPLCEGATLNLTASTVSGAIYNWTGPNNFNNQQNPSVLGTDVADAGTYSVVAMIGTCSSLADTTDVIIAPPPSTPIASSNSPVCEGDSLHLMAANIVGATFDWTGPNTFTNEQNPNVANVSSADDGLYTVIATIGSCSSTPATITVVIEPSPVLVSPSSNSPLCSGATLTLDADNLSGASYSWTGPNGFSVNLQSTTRPNITVPDSGDYELTVSVGNCSSTEIVHVVVDETPIAPVLTASSTTICASDSVEVCAPSGFASYLWNQNGETTECGAAKFAGGLWVDVTATNGCSVRSNTLSISVLPVPTVSIVKQGDTLSTFGAVSYQWFKDGGAINGATSAVYIANGSGTYSVQITDVNGCKATSSGLVITGILEFSTLQGIEVFPNPSSRKFNIRYSGEGSKSVEVSLFNVIGEQVYHRAALFQNGVAVPIDVSNCSKGIYFLQVQTSSEKAIQKLVIE
ncbi:MAG: T9SS type A sorting domain-containing protein [Bacteroidetes bacterium]|nr:T9SS type A sorting domain-containing protein [Bacteroidota bacterium]